MAKRKGGSRRREYSRQRKAYNEREQRFDGERRRGQRPPGYGLGDYRADDEPRDEGAA